MHNGIGRLMLWLRRSSKGGRRRGLLDGVAGAQAEAADLRGRDVDVVRVRHIIRFG